MQSFREWIRQVGRHVGTGSLFAVFLSGCIGFVEDTRESVTEFFVPPDPVQVLTTSESGDKRSRALQNLKEPLKNGGSQAQQDEVVNLLIQTATASDNSICRLQAIRTLGRFEDPRGIPALVTAYYKADSFLPQTNNLIKQQALTSLSEKDSPEARNLLIKVARASAEEPNSYDRQLTFDERLAAIRGLGNFNQPESIETLVHILKTDRDVAIRNRANESLQKVTGRDLPAEAEQWERVLFQGQAPAPQVQKGPIQSLLGN